MKEVVKTMWAKPVRTVFIFTGIGWVTTKIVKAVKKKNGAK